MSRGNVEGQGLTDWHRVTWIVNFLCVRGVIKKTISYYLSQELWWQIPKKFFFFVTPTLASIFRRVQKQNDLYINLCMNKVYKLMRK